MGLTAIVPYSNYWTVDHDENNDNICIEMLHPINMMSDPELEVHKLYGAWGEKKNYGKTYMGTIRTTVVIDEEGKIMSFGGNVRAKGNAQRTLGLLP